MGEKFTPNESFVVQEKKEKHDMSKEEAQYYHLFLESLRGKILKRIDLSKEEDRKNNRYSLGSFLSREQIASFIEEAKRDAGNVSIKPEHEFVQVDVIRDMSPGKLVEYLDELDSSIIK